MCIHEPTSTHVFLTSLQGFSKELSKLLKGKTVASFGDGPGMYKKHIDTLGEVSSYDAYDGAPFCESTTEGRVSYKLEVLTLPIIEISFIVLSRKVM